MPTVKNYDKWVQYNRPAKQGEVNVRAELLKNNSTDDYAIIFDNSFDLVDAAMSNIKCRPYFNGNGSWRFGSIRVDGSWAYGSDPQIKNINDLYKHMSQGLGSTYANKIYDKERALLANQFPELAQLQEVGMSIKRRRVWREDGDELDIDRYMNGDFEQWTSMRKTMGAKRTCTIVYEAGTSAGTSADTFVKSMASLVALSDIVESAGIATEIIIAYTSKNLGDYERNKTIAVKAKNIGEQIDVQRLLSLSSGGLLRSYIFAIYENMSVNDKPTSFYGTAIDIADKINLFGDLWGADIHVQGGDAFTNPQKMKVLIENIVKIFGLQTDDALMI